MLLINICKYLLCVDIIKQRIKSWCVLDKKKVRIVKNEEKKNNK